MVDLAVATKCPDCGSTLSQEGRSEGLCPSCLLELALEETSAEAEVLVEPDAAPTLQFSGSTFEEGQIQGERYRVRSLLGRGGMGEVWRAYDLKLRQDVALKSLRTELIQESEALETLRQEVRTAREVISPNVCRVFDLQELDGQELVSMEYIDGTTLQEILGQRSPLDLDEAREIASQFLAGLEAIHDAGLVHRDIKPENIMLTRTGRVVVMDFGIAKGLGDGKSGGVAGTPAYMSPEQVQGGELDARTDVFSAGVVLAEMVAPGGTKSFEDRQRVWEGIHQETPVVADTPWSRVIGLAISPAPDNRYETASALARALEEVTLRAAGDEEARPYPGLAAFQEEDARFFFGRELEVEALWKKLRRPHLLAVVGPSGAGKSSFLRAGLLPTLTDGWRAVVATPGERPFYHLARALAAELGGAPRTGDLLQRIEEPGVALELLSEWCRGHKHALLIVDQFEELFTQCLPEVQERFVDLLGRLPLEADVHVLLAMRDDFLLHCQSFEPLAPLFSELTPLGPPTGASLRRAIVQPALKCGYRFEDEAVVEEMLSEVEGQRGALPLLAFAAEQLWERRDRDTGFLTRKSYEQIGGVGGALAQHAEAILDYIGESNTPIVRELFRNLVTAQGTRTARDREELLSVFPEAEGEPFLEPSRVKPTPVPPPQRPAAKHVLNSLIDARLLTSYEVPGEDGEDRRQRIEIVHESLLSSWPRLVRWQMQDAEGAQLRDELRQQAQLWDEHDRAHDYLWSGAAYLDYLAWRQRYPGGLTSVEEEFARAMTDHAERRRRRRRVLLTASFVMLLAVLGVMATLWWRGELARREAVAEAQRAEASKLLALGRLELDNDPTSALAYTIASLELSDQSTARRFLVDVAWRSPVAFLLSDEWTWKARFSPDGEWLAAGGKETRLDLFSRSSGERLRLEGKRSMPLGFSADSTMLVTEQHRTEESLRTWSVSDGSLLHLEPIEDTGAWEAYYLGREDRVLTLEIKPGWQEVEWYSRPMLEGEARLLGRENAFTWTTGCTDAEGRWLAFAADVELLVTPLASPSVGTARVVGRHEEAIAGCAIDIGRERAMSIDVAGILGLWNLTAPAVEELGRYEVGESIGAESRAMAFSEDGRFMAFGTGDAAVRIWDEQAPPGAQLQILRRGEIDFVLGVDIDPSGKWLVASEDQGTALWPLQPARTYRLSGHTSAIGDLTFSPDGDWLLSASWDRTIQRWPLSPEVAARPETILRHKMMFERVELDPSGQQLAFMTATAGPILMPAGGGEMVFLEGTGYNPRALTWDAEGIWIAAGGRDNNPEHAVIRLWNPASAEIHTIVEAGEEYGVVFPASTLDAGDGKAVTDLRFLADGDLLSAGQAGVRRWSVAEGTFTHLLDGPVAKFDLPDDQSSAVLLLGVAKLEGGPVSVLDLVTGDVREIPSHGALCLDVALDRSGRILVTGDEEGIVRVGSIDGSEPHLLVGHTGSVQSVEVSPDGEWIASAGSDTSIRLWRMPDVTQPPLHTLPHEELLAKLRSLTNLQAIEDAESDTGWSIEIGPFPGWGEVPTW